MNASRSEAQCLFSKRIRIPRGILLVQHKNRLRKKKGISRHTDNIERYGYRIGFITDIMNILSKCNLSDSLSNYTKLNSLLSYVVKKRCNMYKYCPIIHNFHFKSVIALSFVISPIWSSGKKLRLIELISVFYEKSLGIPKGLS